MIQIKRLSITKQTLFIHLTRRTIFKALRLISFIVSFVLSIRWSGILSASVPFLLFEVINSNYFYWIFSQLRIGDLWIFQFIIDFLANRRTFVDRWIVMMAMIMFMFFLGRVFTNAMTACNCNCSCPPMSLLSIQM